MSKKLYRVTLTINEIVEAKDEDQAIQEFEMDGYKLRAEEIVNPDSFLKGNN